jgi:hypothetical protein
MSEMEKSWAERIREARVRGGFTEDDYVAILDFQTCLVGDCLKASGHAVYNSFGRIVLPQDMELYELGTSKVGEHISPIRMVDDNDFDALEAHLLKVQARVDALYGEPPSVVLRALRAEEEEEEVFA